MGAESRPSPSDLEAFGSIREQFSHGFNQINADYCITGIGLKYIADTALNLPVCV